MQKKSTTVDVPKAMAPLYNSTMDNAYKQQQRFFNSPSTPSQRPGNKPVTPPNLPAKPPAPNEDQLPVPASPAGATMATANTGTPPAGPNKGLPGLPGTPDIPGLDLGSLFGVPKGLGIDSKYLSPDFLGKAITGAFGGDSGAMGNFGKGINNTLGSLFPPGGSKTGKGA
jgi:hypothetical protein